jgi:hypothetical protein
MAIRLIVKTTKVFMLVPSEREPSLNRPCGQTGYRKAELLTQDADGISRPMEYPGQPNQTDAERAAVAQEQTSHWPDQDQPTTRRVPYFLRTKHAQVP